MEKWFVLQKKADFNAIAERFHIHPVTARLIRNRDIIGDEAIGRYLNGGTESLYDPHLLKDADRLTEILAEKIRAQASIRIIGDYDIDGVMATYILYQGIRRCHGVVDTVLPDRLRDGYGINMHLIDRAREEGVDTILTCDNGIAAIEEIAHAKELGMTVLVTDHHEIPYEEADGVRICQKSVADAIVNPKQPDCPYPFSGLCGAAVAFKVIWLLYERMGLDGGEAMAFLENVAFATVGDVMDLVDENRILVREGLKRIHHTANYGMRALILQNGLEPDEVDAYHIGFVLGPCINASGRLDTARMALELFLQEDAQEAARIASGLVELNVQRKGMTAEGVMEAEREVAAGNCGKKVLVIFLPQVHESLAGIIAGRIREKFNRPVFVLTRSEDGVKGSGRSVEAYSMYEELCRCREFLTKFGGHPMAAGLSMHEEDIDAFREKLNRCCPLGEEDFIPKVRVDIAMPMDYPDVRLVEELSVLEPFGKANAKPQFADRGLAVVRAAVLGKNRNVLRLTLETERGQEVSAVYFGDIEQFLHYYAEKFGEKEVERALHGQENAIRLSVVYDPRIDTYRGNSRIQFVIRNYQ